MKCIICLQHTFIPRKIDIYISSWVLSFWTFKDFKLVIKMAESKHGTKKLSIWRLLDVFVFSDWVVATKFIWIYGITVLLGEPLVNTDWDVIFWVRAKLIALLKVGKISKTIFFMPSIFPKSERNYLPNSTLFT